MAKQRLIWIQRKITRNSEFGVTYKNIMNNYIKKQYARKLNVNEVNSTSCKTFSKQIDVYKMDAMTFGAACCCPLC